MDVNYEEMLIEIERIANAAAKIIATPNWAAIASVVISFLAVIVAAGVAIYVAQKQNKITEKQTEIALKQAEIAEQQNKIALFDKRYEVYCEFQKTISIRWHTCIEHDTGISKTNLLYAIGVIYGFDSQSDDKSAFTRLFAQFEVSEYQMKQALFLFSGVEESDINNLLKARFGLTSFLLAEDESEDKCLKEFTEECDYFEKKYFGMMEKQLNPA